MRCHRACLFVHEHADVPIYACRVKRAITGVCGLVSPAAAAINLWLKHACRFKEHGEDIRFEGAADNGDIKRKARARWQITAG